MNSIDVNNFKCKLKEKATDKNKILQFLIDVFLFLFLCTKTGIGKYAILEVAFLGMFLILLGYKIIKNKEKIQISLYNIWYILFAILACMSYFWAMSKEFCIKVFPSIIALVIFSIAIMNYIKDKNDFNKLLKLFVGANMYSAVKILIFYWFCSGTPASRIMEITGIYFNTVAQVMGFSIIVTFYLYKVTNKKIYWGLILPQIITILLTESRKGILIPIIGIFIIVLLEKKEWKVTIKYIITFFIGVILIATVILSKQEYKAKIDELFKSITQGETTDYSINLRNFFISTGIEIFENNPVAGIGINNFAYYVKNNTEYNEARYAHNNYIEVLSTTGTLGFVLYYWIYIWIILKLIMNNNRQIKNVFAFSLIITLAIFDWGIVSYSGCMYNVIIFIAYIITDNKKIGDIEKDEK